MKKLNLGSGTKPLDGYINIDMFHRRKVNLVHDCSKPLLFDNESVDEVFSSHLFEHLKIMCPPNTPDEKASRWLIEGYVVVLKDWYRVLREGGKVIIEIPDFENALKNYLRGDLTTLTTIFGLRRHEGDIHYCGFNFKHLKILLGEAGFRDIKKVPAVRENSIRVEGIK